MSMQKYLSSHKIQLLVLAYNTTIMIVINKMDKNPALIYSELKNLL